VRTILWRLLALLCVVLAVAGALLPVLPSVPFLLVAAWAGGKGWPVLEQWLLAHPSHGPVIRRWRDHGAVPRRAKWLAVSMMTVSAAILLLSPVPGVVQAVVIGIMLAVAGWLWRRPDA
jgi:uncharacterized membrane protein YbaN (DUF454 family)